MISRRKFITQAAAASAAFTILPRFVLGGKGYIAPSDTLYIAGIGVGGKGTSDLTGFAGSPDGKTIGSPNAKIAFLCRVDHRQSNAIFEIGDCKITLLNSTHLGLSHATLFL